MKDQYLPANLIGRLAGWIAEKFQAKVEGKGLSANDYTDAEKQKLAGIADGANKYAHPTGAGSNHIPAGGAEGQILRWSADGAAAWGADNDTTYKAATQSADGLMAAADKKKLDGVADGANKYVHPSATAHESGLYKIATNELGHVTAAKAVVKDDITALGVPSENTTYNPASENTDGLMTAADKKKLNGIAAGANAYVHPTGAGNNHIPAGGADGQILRWSSAGTAAWGADNNTTYNPASESANGLMTADDKKKLNGIAAGANAYVHPTGAGNNHIPAGGAAGQILRWSSAGVAAWGADNNTTYNPMTGASADAAGTAGLVPQPTAGAANRYLRSDGTWQVPPNTTYPGAGADAAGVAKLYAATGSNTDGSMTQKAVTDALNGKAASGHTHPYAGSSTAGGAATSALACTGNAATATKLAAAHKINGVPFDGSEDITIADGTKVPTSRKINNKALTGDIALTASDVGAAAASHTHPYAGSDTAGGAATTAKTCTGNAATATQLAAAHKINGVAFNGAADVNFGTLAIVKLTNTDFHTYVETFANVHKSSGEEANVFRFFVTEKTPGDYHLPCIDQQVILFSIDNGVTYLNALAFDIRSSDTYRCARVNQAWTNWIKIVDGNRKINNKALSGDIALTASDVGAAASGHTHTAAQVGALPSRGVQNTTTQGPLAKYDTDLVTSNTIAYWNGAYSTAGASNLAYCKHGALGTIVTKNAGDYAASSHGHGDASESASGFLSAADKKKLNGIAAGANAYVHPTGAGNNHIPAGGAAGQILRWSAAGVAAWGADNNTTYNPASESANGLMTADDKKKLNGIAAGANAYVHPTGAGNNHIPAGGAAGQILRWSSAGVAAWGADNNTTYNPATQGANGLMAAADKKKLDGLPASVTSSTTDLNPGVSALANGAIYLVYE